MHVLLDFENVQPTMEELVGLVHGPNEVKPAQRMAREHSHV